MADSTSNNTPSLMILQVLYLVLGAATCFLEGYHQAHTQLRFKLKTAEQELRKLVQELKERDRLIEDLLDLHFPEQQNIFEEEEEYEDENENELKSRNRDFDDPEAPTKNADNEIVYTPQNSGVNSKYNVQGIETDSDSDSSVPTEEIGPLYGDSVSSSSDSSSEYSDHDGDEDGNKPIFHSSSDYYKSYGDEDEGYYSDGGHYYYYDPHDSDVYEECCCRFSGSFDQIRKCGDEMAEGNESTESVEDWLELMKVEKPEAVMENDEGWEGENEESFVSQVEEEWEEIFMDEEGENADDEAELSEDEEDEKKFTSAAQGFEEEEFVEEDFEEEEEDDEGFEEEESEDAEHQDEERNIRNEDATELWRGQTRVMEKVRRPLEVVNQNTMVRADRAAR